MKTSFLSIDEINAIGFKSVGENVFISQHASFYNPSEIYIGDNVRIDDFCILSGNITIENYVHISAYVALYGSRGIYIRNYSGISAHSVVYTTTDDFSGRYLIGAMLPPELTNVIGGPVVLEEFTQIGASSVVLPNLIIKQGSVVGAMSFVNKTLDEWGIYAGIPVKRIKERSKTCMSFVEVL